ncbi:MAG: ShlB/FhaC/HecB family hemolysin secretion/activation protein [Gammaproteobacteria bacterium]|nr:ShlB/FhaC/HecB family hemolysin secretion/activation protein [Gammaproteobacteria bacterium]
MDLILDINISKSIVISSLLFSNLYAAVLPVPEIDIGNIEPERVGRVFTDKPRGIVAKDGKLVIPLLTQSLELGDAKNYVFKLKKVNFVGNNAINSDELEGVYKPYYGKKISLVKILELIHTTTIQYREAGYILSQAYLPAQDIDKNTGLIKIGIVEGYVNEVRISSDTIPYATKILLEQYGDRLRAERPITKWTLERYALLAKDLPGGDIKVVFSPSNRPGAADVEFIADNQKIVAIEGLVDNRGTRLLGPIEFSGTMHQFNGLYGNHTLFNAVRDDGTELRVYNFNHRQPLNSDGLALIVQVARTETDANFNDLPRSIRPSVKINTPGISKSVYAMFEYPFVRSRNLNLIADLKLDGYDTVTKFFGNKLFDEKIRALRASLVVDWLDPYFYNILALTSIGIEFSHGLNNLGAKIIPALATRPDTKENFNKIMATASRQQPLLERLDLKLVIAGQYAFDELISTEEYGYGGRDIGLGYDSYELSGDHGLVGKLELGYTMPIEKITKNISLLSNWGLQAFGFYDAGRVWNINHRKSAQNSSDSAQSAGLGIRGKIFKYMNYETYIAKPLARKVQNQQSNDARFFFVVGFAYPQ